jgi:thiol-disulfide isomerase/thioredoxin
MMRNTNKRLNANKSKYNRLKKSMKTRKNQVQSSHPIVIGKIYANWCGHCMSLKPLWKEMKKKLRNMEKSKKSKFVFIEIESSKEDQGKLYVNDHYLKNSPNKLDLQGGYPTLFKIIDGKLSYYESNEGRGLPQLMSWSLQRV